MMIPTRRKRQKICEDMGFSRHFMDLAATGMRKYPERYPNGVITSGHVTIFDVEMFMDWIKYRDALSAKVPVPPFRREDYQT